MRIKVTSHLADLQADCVKIATQAPKDMRATVRDGIKAGNTLAVAFAKQSAGAHGKLYPRAFSTELGGVFSGFGTSIFFGEYGPVVGRPQGGMSFERGSRNQKPHLDLARSADIIGPSFAQEVRRLPDGWFW